MGTTAPEKSAPVGYITRATGAISEVYEQASETTYGRRGGSLYPVILLAVIAIALVLTAGPALLLGVGLVAILLMGIWVGGGGGRHAQKER